jgi:mRNA-degrading endonuclease RelE of RelBE toxin-antitoxin system
VASAVFPKDAERDLKRKAIRYSPDLPAIRAGIDALKGSETGLDIVALQGRPPWRRLRVGDFRIIFRLLDDQEVAALGLKGRVYLIARVVNRRDLDQAASRL